MTYARVPFGEACDTIVAEFDALIGRHFVARRTLVVSNDEVKFWTASIGDTVLYRSPDRAATIRFAHAFAAKTPGIVVELEWVVPKEEHSVRVPPKLTVVQ